MRYINNLYSGVRVLAGNLSNKNYKMPTKNKANLRKLRNLVFTFRAN